MPVTFTNATEIVRPGGTVANVGVHGAPVELKINELWISDIAITMGLVSTSALDMLLKLVASKQLPAELFVTHEFTFDQMLEAYEVFGNAAQEKAIKVLIRGSGEPGKSRPTRSCLSWCIPIHRFSDRPSIQSHPLHVSVG